jgi:hypothetical protein
MNWAEHLFYVRRVCFKRFHYTHLLHSFLLVPDISFTAVFHGFFDETSKGLDDVWIKMLACAGTTFSYCLLKAQRLIIRPLSGHRVEGICCTDDPGAYN